MLNFISNIFNAVGEFLNTIKEVITAGVEIINMIFSFIPNPFQEITLTFIVVVIGIIIYKVVRS